MKCVVQLRSMDRALWHRARIRALENGETMSEYVARLIAKDLLAKGPGRKKDSAPSS